MPRDGRAIKQRAVDLGSRRRWATPSKAAIDVLNANEQRGCRLTSGVQYGKVGCCCVNRTCRAG